MDTFWSKVDTSGECWEWTAARDRDGYGVFHPRRGITVKAHRYAAACMFGMFDRRTLVLHSCDNPPCVRHLYLGDQGQNMRDKIARGRDHNAAKTECANGHAYTPDNTYLKPSGHRDCRVCIRARVAAYKRRVAA